MCICHPLNSLIRVLTVSNRIWTPKQFHCNCSFLFWMGSVSTQELKSRTHVYEIVIQFCFARFGLNVGIVSSDYCRGFAVCRLLSHALTLLTFCIIPSLLRYIWWSLLSLWVVRCGQSKFHNSGSLVLYTRAPDFVDACNWDKGTSQFCPCSFATIFQSPIHLNRTWALGEMLVLRWSVQCRPCLGCREHSEPYMWIFDGCWLWRKVCADDWDDILTWCKYGL